MICITLHTNMCRRYTPAFLPKYSIHISKNAMVDLLSFARIECVLELSLFYKCCNQICSFNESTADSRICLYHEPFISSKENVISTKDQKIGISYCIISSAKGYCKFSFHSTSAALDNMLNKVLFRINK